MPITDRRKREKLAREMVKRECGMSAERTFRELSADNNKSYRNNFFNNGLAVNVTNGSNNIICHNNFFENALHVDVRNEVSHNDT